MAEEILVLFADITFRFEKKHVALTSAGIWAIKGWISRPKQKVMIGWKEFLAHPIRARALMKIAVGGAEIEYDGPTESVVSFLKQLQLEAAGC